MTNLDLPEPIAAYFDADKRRRRKSWRACFTKPGRRQGRGTKLTPGSHSHQGMENCGVRPNTRTPASHSQWSRGTAGTSSVAG